MPASVFRRGTVAALVLLTLIWGYNWIVMKQVLRDTGPFAFAALRASIATVVLFALLAARRESLRPPPVVPTLLIGLTQTTAFQSLIQWALVDGGAGKTALLAYTMPFWVVLLAWFALAERPSVSQRVHSGLAALGLLLVLQPWTGFGNLSSALLALVGGLAWAVSVVLSKRLFRAHDVSALRLTAWQMAFGAIGLIVLSAAVPERAIAWTPSFIVALAYNAVLASGLAWALWAMIVQRVPASVAGLTSLAVPIAGILLAWAILGERPTLVETLGIVVIGVALLGISRAPRPAAA